MSGNSWFFSLMILAGLVSTSPASGQSTTPLIGHWVATVPAQKGAFIVRDGDTIRYKGKSAYTITLNFESDKTGSTQWDSSIPSIFTYRLVKSNLIEFRDSKGCKSSRDAFTIKDNKLRLSTYPAPKEPQESIALQYTLTFIKQP